MKILKITGAVALVVAVVVGGVIFWLYRAVNEPVRHDKSNTFVVIPKGSSTAEIADKLAAEGIISNAAAFRLYLRLSGDSSRLKAGEYQFSSPISAVQLIKELEKGEERTIKVTIPEGFTRFDIAKRLVEKFPTVPPTTEAEVLAMMDDVTPIKDLAPTARNLEGYMYPSTYSFPIGTKPAEVIKRMTDQFRRIWKPEWTEKARGLGRTPQEIVTIASLIETESKFDAERQQVASVIYNRLAKSIPLGIDQTAVYIAKMENRWDGTIHKSDLESASPYNTRKFAGIPPGPIASVSESSIDAALNPATTNYIFYVLDVEKNDGSHLFFESAADFERAKRKYQEWLATQRR